MYKTGDKFIIEIDSVMTNKKGTLYGIKGFNSLVFDENGLDRLTSYNEEFDNSEEVTADAEKYGYEKGLSDVRNFVKKFQDFTIKNENLSISKEAFGCNGLLEILEKYTPQEAIEKLKAWEEKQEIKVGDVIKSCNGNTVVIQYIDAWDRWECFSKSGYFTLDHEKQKLWKKTGKHIDLTEIFKGLEGENAD